MARLQAWFRHIMFQTRVIFPNVVFIYPVNWGSPSGDARTGMDSYIGLICCH